MKALEPDGFARRRAIDQLADQISELAGHLNASTCRFLELVAEFDARGGWSDWGAKSCAHWLSWRCSIEPVTAREQVRVARRLVELPLIRGAFADGRLSYSKVRALTRIEEIEREDELLELALYATASQLERMVRGYRKVTNAGAAKVLERRSLHIRHDDDGSLIFRGRLPREEGAVFLKALELARNELRQARWRGQRAGEAAPVPDVDGSAGTDGEGASAEAGSVGADDAAGAGTAGASAEAGSVGADHAAGAGTASASAEARSVPDVDGSAGGARVGDSAEAPTAPVRDADATAGKAGEDPDDGFPRSDPAFEVGGALIEAPDQEARDIDALLILLDEAVRSRRQAAGRTGGDRFQVVVHVDLDTLARKQETGADSLCELEDGGGLAAETARRLCCDASIVPLTKRDDTILDVGRKTRSIPPAVRRALQARDGGCRFPGCTQHRHVDAHHLVHWAHGGPTSLDNLILLCRHHHTLLHEGGYTVTVQPRRPGGTRTRLVFRRPDGRRLLDTPHIHGRTTAVADHSHATGLTITPTTSQPGWCGERMDLHYAVLALLHMTGHRREA
jgi:hypothetical protein